MARSTPQAFRRAGDAQQSPGDSLMSELAPGAVTETMRSAVAAWIYEARTHADLLATGADGGLAAVDLDRLLDPTYDPAERRGLFRRLLTIGMAQHRLAAIDPRSPDDEEQLSRLWEALFDWGSAVQQLLDDPAITTISILGTTVIGDGPHGRVGIYAAFPSAREPLSRAEVLAQGCGLVWNQAAPAVTVALRSGTQLELTREPLVGAQGAREPGVRLVLRRGRVQPWTLPDLIARGMLDQPTAGLLIGLVQAGGSLIIAGPPGAGKTMLLESLLSVLPAERQVVVVEDDGPPLRLPDAAVVSRLYVNDQPAHAADVDPQRRWSRQLQLKPGVVVLSEVGVVTAGAVLAQAEAGRTILTTIEAGSSEAALRRFARLAAVAKRETFGSLPAEALAVLSEAFHALVQVTWSDRLQRQLVQQVLLLNGLDTNGRPVTIPLVESHIDATTIVWHCHARIADRALVWLTPGPVTPQALAERLADRPGEQTPQEPAAIRAPGVAIRSAGVPPISPGSVTPAVAVVRPAEVALRSPGVSPIAPGNVAPAVAMVRPAEEVTGRRSPAASVATQPSPAAHDAASASVAPLASAPLDVPRRGWLDEALERSRERLRLRQGTPTEQDGTG